MLKCVVLAFLIIGCVYADIKQETTNIDMLTDRYLALETALWGVIRSGAAQKSVIQQINDIHVLFFAEDFNEKGVYCDKLDADQFIIYSAINRINLTTDSVKTQYLHKRAEDYRREQTVSVAQNVANLTKQMEKMFNVTHHKDFFKYIANKGRLQSCMISTPNIKSENQFLYDYYTDISAAQLKAYALVQLSYMFLTVYNVENYVMRGQSLNYLFKDRNAKTRVRVKELMAGSNRDVWRCDPDTLSDFADQVTRLVQGYVDNEVNLNPSNDCKKSCSDYQLTSNHLCYNGSYCATPNDHQTETDLKCNGVVLNCDFISGNMNICPLDYGDRRYSFIQYDCGTQLGSDHLCANTLDRVKSWKRWFVECSQCFCYCDEKGPKSDRYFSLRPVLSDTSANMVITSVAIRKHNRMFVWRITQGQLINNAQINVTNNEWQKWKPLDLFRLTDYDVDEGVDYHTLSWQNRSIDLDELVAPPGQVITGIRFAVDSGILKIAIRATSFDFNTGELFNIVNSEWISKTINDRTPIILEQPEVSTKCLSKSVPNVEKNKYIEFGPTDRYLDAAQTTVPFIDIQMVEPSNPVPLSGVGIYYKGQPHYGGFIAPKLITYDFEPYIKSAQTIVK